MKYSLAIEKKQRMKHNQTFLSMVNPLYVSYLIVLCLKDAQRQLFLALVSF